MGRQGLWGRLGLPLTLPKSPKSTTTGREAGSRRPCGKREQHPRRRVDASSKERSTGVWSSGVDGTHLAQGLELCGAPKPGHQRVHDAGLAGKQRRVPAAGRHDAPPPLPRPQEAAQLRHLQRHTAHHWNEDPIYGRQDGSPMSKKAHNRNSRDAAVTPAGFLDVGAGHARHNAPNYTQLPRLQPRACQPHTFMSSQPANTARRTMRSTRGR
jgi:hypothetical protein